MRTHYSTAAEVLKQNGFEVEDSITSLMISKLGKRYVVDIDEKHTVNFRKIIGVLEGIYPSMSTVQRRHYFRTDIYVWESGFKKLVTTLAPVDDAKKTIPQLKAWLDTRYENERGHSDHSYECFWYEDDIKAAREWILILD